MERYENRVSNNTSQEVIKVGIIGLGVGEKHAREYQKHPKCKIITLCDFSEDKLKNYGRKYKTVKLTKHADEILTDPEIDAVSIASYDNYHYEQVMKAINNNKHIFIEKPLCLFEDEAIKIKRALENRPDIKLSSNLNLRTSPRFKWLKKYINDGGMGEIFYMEGDYLWGRLYKLTDGWRGEMPYYSIVHGASIHLVDLLYWLINDKVIEVCSYGNKIASKNSKCPYNDFNVSLLKFSNGILAKVTGNAGAVYPHYHGVKVYGTKATFINGMEKGQMFESNDPQKRPIEIMEEYLGNEKGSLIRSFIDSILYDKEPEVTKFDVFNVMSVCFAIEKAAKESKIVDVTYI